MPSMGLRHTEQLCSRCSSSSRCSHDWGSMHKHVHRSFNIQLVLEVALVAALTLLLQEREAHLQLT
jgi:hypothetical protein